MTLLKECGLCKRLIPYGSTYCATCKPIMQARRERQQEERRKQYNKRYNAHRDPKYTRFYHSKEWKTLAAWYAQSKGFRCEACHAIASDVHHRMPIQVGDGWERKLDPDNLELLCVRCHNKRHGRFQPKHS